MVDAARVAVGVDQQVLGRVHETQRRGIERAVGLAGLAGAVRRRNGFRERRLVAERARGVDRAEQQLQQVQRAAGVEAVAVRADAAHRVHRDRAADHLGVLAAVRVGPRDRQRDGMVERGFGQFARDPADGVGGDPAAFADRVGRVLRVEVAFGDEVERRHRGAAIGQRDLADDRRRHVDAVRVGGGVGGAVEAQRLAVGIAREQAVVGAAGIAHHQPVRVGVAHQVVEVDAVGLEQFMDQREREQPVGAGPDPDPLVGDRAVAACAPD